jgi:hypothetical protein
MEAATRTAPVETEEVRLSDADRPARGNGAARGGEGGDGDEGSRSDERRRNGNGACGAGDRMGLARGGPRPLMRGCSTETGAEARDVTSMRTSSAPRVALEMASGALAPVRNERGAPER